MTRRFALLPAHPQFDPQANRHAVQLRDGQALELQPVFDRGQPVRHLRAVKLPEGSVVVDVRHLVRDLGADLCTALPADVPGLVTWSLRLHYPTRDRLEAAVRAAGQPQQVAA